MMPDKDRCALASEGARLIWKRIAREREVGRVPHLDEVGPDLRRRDTGDPFVAIASERLRIPTDEVVKNKTVFLDKVLPLANHFLSVLPEGKNIQFLSGSLKWWCMELEEGIIEFQVWMDAAWDGSAKFVVKEERL